MIDKKVVATVREQHERARTMLSENRRLLDRLAAYLYEKETITGEEFMSIVDEARRESAQSDGGAE